MHKITSSIYKYYDKLILALALSVFALLYIFKDNFEIDGPKEQIKYHKIRLKKSSNNLLLYPQKVTDLMPGEKIYYQLLEDGDWQNVEIQALELSKRTSLEIVQKNGEILNGELIANAVLPKDWQKIPDSLSIRSNRKTTFIPFKQILRIRANQGLVISNAHEEVNWETSVVSYYQRSSFEEDSINYEKTRWLAPRSDNNSSNYDLFTPPIIYIHEGKLTTRRPDKETVSRESEDFGLILNRASKAPYDFRLISWIGNTPYFEDLKSPLASDSSSFTRNRLEVGKSYKRNVNWKPGQPSLVICENDDNDRLLMIEHFVVQQHKNSKTGGLRPVGRALLKDFKLGGEPFEVNSLMTEVYAGDYTFEFTFSLSGIDEEKFSFSSKDTGKDFLFSGRKYTVSLIDLTNNTIKISKKDPREPDDTLEVFNY